MCILLLIQSMSWRLLPKSNVLFVIISLVQYHWLGFLAFKCTHTLYEGQFSIINVELYQLQ